MPVYDVPQESQQEQRDPGSQPPQELLHDDLFPKDAYSDDVYWADLPRQQCITWVNNQYNSEVRREWGVLMDEFKQDPLQPFRDYFSRYVITGMGLFVEGYTLFSVGNIESLFRAVWPLCWEQYTECDANWVASIGYLEIVGIILGQLVVGVIGDWIGRRWGMIQDALVMLIGTVLLTAMWGNTLNGWVIMYAFSLLIYAFGVGGEYPMTSTGAMEGNSGRTSSTGDKLHRGRTVSLAFTMQGWGQLVNQSILIICLLTFHGGGNPPYSKDSTQYTFRVSFAFVGLLTLWLVYYRVYKLKYADNQLRISKRKSSVTGYDKKSLKLVMTHYWHRLVGTAGTWFCNDFFFYGNKIFQSVFIKIISPDSTVMTGWLWNLLNIGCSLVGYYMAAFLIDHKFYGRRRMQAVGFLADFILFVVSAALFDTLQTPGTPVKVFQFLYFFSSFWNQFGPNSTTFLLAAEVYPAPIRSTAHGISAATGKLGALIPAITYNYVSNETKFWIVSWFGLLGFVLTVVFIPDTTGLDLREQERYWLQVREGRPQDYHGIAIHPRHLSFFERFVLRRHRNYDPELDRIARISELRIKYEESISSKTSFDAAGPSKDDDISDNVSRYFQMEKGNSPWSEEASRESQEKLSGGTGKADKLDS